MKCLVLAMVVLAASGLDARLAGADQARSALAEADALPWPADLPVYDHVVIVVEENKGYEQIVGNPAAAYINNVLKREGANFTRAYAEEHFSEGNYFWLFSGDNQNVGYLDRIPSKWNNSAYPFTTANLGQQLIAKGLSFKGYAESLPAIGFSGDDKGLYARKHVPWISFANVPNGTTRCDVLQPQVCGLSAGSRRLSHPADRGLRHSQSGQRYAQRSQRKEHSRG